MNKKWMVAIGAVLLLAVVGLVGCSSAPSGTLELTGNLYNQQEGIWVNGEGKVPAVPDVAILSVGIESQEATVEAAREKAAEAMDNVMQVLKDQGIDEKDIQTQYFNISRVTRWDNDKQTETVIGYRVTNTVTSKVRDVEKAGIVIDEVATAGGDLTRINSIGFTVDDPSEYYEQARKLAVEDAADKAKILADAAGVNLGKVYYITENTYVPSPVYRGDMVAVPEAAPGISTPISPGEIEITVNVNLAYEID